MKRISTRQALAILATAALLSAAWTWLAGIPGVAAEFAEHNQAANRIRIEEYLARPAAPSNVIVGSSLSGRLLASYFAGTPLADMANLGLDGSGPLVGIEVMLRRADLPETVWVETYLMGRGTTPNDRALLEGLGSAGTRLALAAPLFRASRRPSSVAYSALKRRKEGGGVEPTWTTNAAAAEPGPPMPAPRVDLGVEERWRDVMRGLRRRNVRVVLVDLPGGETRLPGMPTEPDLAARLGRELGLERVDLRRAWLGSGRVPRYTDGLHLDAASARETARMLARP